MKLKRSGKYARWVEGECTSHRWPKSRGICGFSRSFQEFQRHLVGSGVQHRKWGGNVLIQGKAKEIMVRN